MRRGGTPGAVGLQSSPVKAGEEQGDEALSEVFSLEHEQRQKTVAEGFMLHGRYCEG
jgi:hypothetical protein